jgi:predicted Zn-dependent peptidase
MAFWSSYFGSGMSSLLFQDIREFRSLAYYAYGKQLLPSIIRHPDERTAFCTRLGTQADKSMTALGVVDSLFAEMPLRDANISAIKQSIINSINNNYPDFRSIGRFIARMRIEGFSDDPDRPISLILPSLGIEDVKAFYTDNVKKTPRAIIIVGNKKSLDMQKLARYGRIVELKKADIYK